MAGHSNNTDSSASDVSPSLVRTKNNLFYLLREFGVGVIVVIVFSVLPNAKAIETVVRFPPDWKPLATYLLPAVALFSWGVARAVIVPKACDREPKYRPAESGFLVNANTWLCKTGALRIITVQAYRKNSPTGSKSDEMTVCRPRVIPCVGLFVAGIICCIGYIAAYSMWVVEPSANAEATKLNAIEHASPAFILPVFPSSEFTRSLALRGGLDTVVDNDQEWLTDALRKESWRVVLTDVLFVVAGLLAVALMVGSMTLLSYVNKAPVIPDDSHEAAGTFISDHIH